MNKILIAILVLILGGIGFLYYDWHVKTKKQAAGFSITLYSWTDESGARHFTDTPPPKSAKNIEKRKGYEYIEPPLAVKIKDKTVKLYGWIKKKIIKRKDQKKKNRPK